MLLTPRPLSQTVTPSRTPSPLERDVLYGRPHIITMTINTAHASIYATAWTGSFAFYYWNKAVQEFPSSQEIIQAGSQRCLQHAAVVSRATVSSLIKASSIDHHPYADDTQLFISFSPNSFSDSIDHLLRVVNQISSWMT